MKRKRSGIILMVLGVVVAFMAGASVFILSPKTSPASSKAEEVKKGKVVMVTQQIGEREVVQPAFVREVEMPVEVIPPDALTKRDDVANKMTTVKLYPNLPVLKDQISTKSVGDGYAFKLDKGKVLVAVNYPGAANIMGSGAVRPGDHVDLIAVTPGENGIQIAPTMQNITVTAVGTLTPGDLGNVTNSQKSSTAGASPSTLLFFEVSEEDAQILKFLETMGIDIVLRAAGDNDVPPSRVVDMNYIVEKFRLQRPPAKQ